MASIDDRPVDAAASESPGKESRTPDPVAPSAALYGRVEPLSRDTLPTSATEWAPTFVTLRLPSGNVARLRRPQMFSLIAGGDIPNPLRGAVLELAGETAGGEQVSPEQRLRALLFIISTCFVEPRVAWDRPPNGGELSMDQIEDADKLALIDWAMEEVVALTGFRGDGAGEAGGGDGGDVPDAAVGAAGDR